MAEQKRELLVETADYWFRNARESQKKRDYWEALLFMENALNHTESTLAAVLRRNAGRDDLSLDEFRKAISERAA